MDSSEKSVDRKLGNRFSQAWESKKNRWFVSQLLGLNCLLHWKSPSETELGSAEVQPNKG